MGMVKTIRIDVTTSEDLWPYQVVNVLQRVMEEGAVKYPKGEGWDEISAFHISRALMHLAEDTDESLTHAFTRLMMAVAIKGGYLNVEEDEFAKRDRETEERIRKGKTNA